MNGECFAKEINFEIQSHIKEKKKMYTINLRPSVMEKMKEVAKLEGISLSELVNHIFLVYLRYYNNNSKCKEKNE